jgi:AmmeMemoRadiSam system protein B
MHKIRLDLDFMPSPAPEQPGLLIRDPYGYSKSVLVVPPALIPALQLLDGEASELDLRHFFVEATGDPRAGEMAKGLVDALDEAGFLDNGRFGEMKAAKHREFAEAPARVPSHIGPGGYPETPEALRATLSGYFRNAAVSLAAGNAIAAPHASPFAAWESYADAYSAIPQSAADRTFVILGTSHYGEPDRFGLTRKPFTTPYGTTRTAGGMIDTLEAAANGAVLMEDYCHAIEHSIEFQVVFLQHMFGPDIQVLPILCGPFGESLRHGGAPEDHEGVRRFLDALAELNAREGNRLFWVMGVDMAHIGRRYGDSQAVQADDATMMEVKAKDESRMRQIELGDAEGFWTLVKEDRDPLRWCGSAPLYTFLRAVPATGKVRRYQQWNIDSASVVSFAAVEFQPRAER